MGTQKGERGSSLEGALESFAESRGRKNSYREASQRRSRLSEWVRAAESRGGAGSTRGPAGYTGCGLDMNPGLSLKACLRESGMRTEEAACRGICGRTSSCGPALGWQPAVLFLPSRKQISGVGSLRSLRSSLYLHALLPSHPFNQPDSTLNTIEGSKDFHACPSQTAHREVRRRERNTSSGSARL